MKVVFISSECEFLGIEYLSAVLKQQGHTTELILDPKLFATELLSFGLLKKHLDFAKILVNETLLKKPDLICFSIASDNLNWALDTANNIKEKTDIPIAFGGIHPTINPKETLQYNCVDYVFIGEAENSICDFANDTTKEDISGFGYKLNDEIIINPASAPITNLDKLPIADKTIYTDIYPKFMTGYKIITSRGCPYKCTYCAAHQIKEVYPLNAKIFRRRSVQNVINELIIAKEKYKPKMIRFFDDVLTSDKQWFTEFAKLYKEKINLPYFCFIHPENCDEEIIELLEMSNCKTAFMGFGTFSEKTRKNVLKRHYSTEKVESLIAAFAKTKIYLLIDFIMGLPAQTEKEVLDMAHFFNRNRPDTISALFLRYYPKTDITKAAIEQQLITKEQMHLVEQGDFEKRIIIEPKLKKKFQKLQFVFLITKYLPQKAIHFILQEKLYRFIPAFDYNNFFVILDSVIPKLNGKKRIHTDTISVWQYIHFHIYYTWIKIKKLCKFRYKKK